MSVLLGSFLGYIAGIVVFLVLDAIMISQVILPTFRKHVRYLIGDIDIVAASIFYVAYTVILYFIAVHPYM